MKSGLVAFGVFLLRHGIYSGIEAKHSGSGEDITVEAEYHGKDKAEDEIVKYSAHLIKRITLIIVYKYTPYASYFSCNNLIFLTSKWIYYGTGTSTGASGWHFSAARLCFFRWVIEELMLKRFLAFLNLHQAFFINAFQVYSFNLVHKHRVVLCSHSDIVFSEAMHHAILYIMFE